jgi:hypothetical protein
MWEIVVIQRGGRVATTPAARRHMELPNMSKRILPPPAAPGPGKHVAFDRATGDYAAYYDGQLLGYRATHPEAQALADQYVHDLFTHGQPVPAGELTAGAE